MQEDISFKKGFLFFYASKWKVFTAGMLLIVFSLVGQPNNIGIPFITNYSNQTYQAGTQNWDIAQHPNGFLFFANNNGLLQFDGANWELFPLKNKTIARALHITQSGRIYIGGQGEFGYFEPDELDRLMFHSLLGYIPAAHKVFSDVWEIVEQAGAIYFSTSEKIYVFDNQKIEVIQNKRIHFLGKAQERLFINNESGLHEIDGYKIKPIAAGDKLANKIVTSILNLEPDRLLLTTLHSGFFELSANTIRPIYPDDNNFWAANRIYSSIELSDTKIATITNNGGLFILDKDGRVIQQLNKQNGLQNNNILSVFKDRSGNLWLGLDNGIDYVAINSPFTRIIPDKEQEGTAYAAKIFDNTIYLGTSSGLYQQDWRAYYNPLQKNDFQLVEGSEGQVWGLDIVDRELFLGHHEGGFLVKRFRLEKISPTIGNWSILQLGQHPKYFLAGTYEGLVLYHKEQGTWRRLKQLDGIKESCRILEQDELGNVWVAHPYRGIYKVQLADDLSAIKIKLYGSQDGLPSSNQNHVFKINDEVIFTGEIGIFQYDARLDRFLPHTTLINLIGKDKSVLRFFEDDIGNIWFVTTEETGVLKIEDKGLKKAYFKKIYPELNKKLVRGFEFIYPYDANNIFVGAEKGFIHFDPTKSFDFIDENFAANIVKVQSLQNNHTLLAGQYTSTESKADTLFPYHKNAFRFSYSAPYFRSLNNLRYATKLEGYDEDWSIWTDKTEKEFTNLRPGNYRFMVKAKSIYEQESKIASFSFAISPPWYVSTQALAIYIFLVVAFLASLILIPQKRFQEEKTLLKSEQKRKEAAHQEKVAKNEQEITALKNKQLQIEIAYKNQELAMSTMHLVQHSELIHQLKEKLNKVIKTTDDTTVIKELAKINRLLGENIQLNEVWNQFAYHFDQVHIDFLKKIKEKYPRLTANDQKLCAYLRMNLSTKEMAPLMNISIRGVEAARYRLRKKLGLDSSVDLNEFMLNAG